MIYYQNDIVTLHWYADVHIGMAVWDGFPVEKNYKDGLNAVIDLVEEHKLNKWLAHLEKLKVISPDLQDWTNKVWFPKAYQVGLRYMAIVQSKDLVGKMSIKDVMQKTNDFTTHYFDDINKAKDWIKGIK